MSQRRLSRIGGVSKTWGPLTFLTAGYGSNAEELGKIAAELRKIAEEEPIPKAIDSKEEQQLEHRCGRVC